MDLFGILGCAAAFFIGESVGGKNKEREFIETVYRLENEHKNKEILELKRQIEEIKRLTS